MVVWCGGISACNNACDQLGGVWWCGDQLVEAASTTTTSVEAINHHWIPTLEAGHSYL